MRTNTFQSRHRQQGVATLLTSLLVLFVITLITFYATQSSVMETNISANQYRTDQSYSAASGAMDYAEALFAVRGVDNDGNGVADCTQAAPCTHNIANPAATQTLAAEYFYCDPDQLAPGGAPLLSAAVVTATNPCTTTNSKAIIGSGRYAGQVGIVATGFSDDRAAQRIMIKAAAVAEIIADGPGSPLSNGGAVGLTGNMTVINRFTDFSVWSGKDVGTKGSADTFLAGTSLQDGICMNNYRAEPQDATLHATCTAYDKTTMEDATKTVQATDKDREGNFDVVDNDPNLDNLVPKPDPIQTNPMATPDAFWDNFINMSKADARKKADALGQLNNGTADKETGIIWIDGDLNGVADIGDLNPDPDKRKSALLVVTGDLKMTGGTIYGIIYVMGDWDVAGNPDIQGAVIVRGTSGGSGNPTVIYDPNAFDDLGGGINGAVVGSWRDW